VWEVFVKIKAELSQIGRPIADMDLLIAATAKRYNLMLISKVQNTSTSVLAIKSTALTNTKHYAINLKLLNWH